MDAENQELVQANSYVAVQGSALTATDIVARVSRIQDIVKRVMKKDEHYGVIPGCKKPSLYAAGAELLLMTFRISPQIERVEDLSTLDEIRYRVTASGISPSGIFLGNHVGECSSNEEKYKWRKPVCPEEFDETPEDRRREVWKKNNYKQKTEKIKQVRVNPADIANTVLAMAEKRGVVGMTRKVTGASSMFTDGIEDLPPDMVGDSGKEPIPPTQRKSEQAEPEGEPIISEAQRKRLWAIFKKSEMTEEDLKAIVFSHSGVQSTKEVPKAKYEAICAEVEAYKA